MEDLFLNFQKTLQDPLLEMRVEQLEEIFSLRKYKVAFFIYYSGFGVKLHKIENNRRGEKSGDIVFIVFRYNSTYSTVAFW